MQIRADARHIVKFALTLLWLTSVVIPMAAWADSVPSVSRVDRIRDVLLDADRTGVMVVSHRGHHRAVPENSVAAIEAAIEAGADIVEIDVRTTADGQLVLMHDATIDRTTTGTGRVDEMTLADLLATRLMHNTRPTAHRIPTLAEAFEAARGRVMLNLDPKGIDFPTTVAIARQAGMLDHCLLKQRWDRMSVELLTFLDENPDVIFMPICRSPAELDEAMSRRPWPAVEILIDDDTSPLWSVAALDGLRGRGARGWINSLWDGRLAAGRGDYQASIHPERVFGELVGLGFTMIQTDLPATLAATLGERGHGVSWSPRDAIERAYPRSDFGASARALRDGTDPRTLVIAHRGHHAEHPENSLAAIRAAFELGADGVEIDVRTTADGHLVLMHDPTVDRTTTGTGAVGDLTLSELRTLSLRHGQYPTREVVPTLAQALEAVRGRGFVYLDLKDADALACVELAERLGVVDHVLIPAEASDDVEALSALVARGAHVKLRVENEEELGRALGRGPWAGVSLRGGPDASSWWPGALERLRAGGVRAYGSALKGGHGPGGLGDRDVFDAGADAVYGGIIDRGFGIFQTDLPEVAVPIVRAADRARARARDDRSGERLGRTLPGLGGPEPTTVMSFNVRYDEPGDGEDAWVGRLGAVAGLIREHGADVVALQEPFAHQVEDLLGALGRYGAIGAHRIDGRVSGEGCVILYDTSRYLVAESGVFWLSDTPGVAGSMTWDNRWPRSCTWARLVDLRSGEGLYVYNVHLDNKGERSKILGARAVLEHIESHATRDGFRDPVVVLGDLNATEGSGAVRMLTSGRSVGLVDAIGRLMPDDGLGTYTGFDPASTGGGRRIDHALVSSDLLLLSGAIDRRKVGGRYPSDHFPVVVRFAARDAALSTVGGAVEEDGR